jgi:hypothetical protein
VLNPKIMVCPLVVGNRNMVLPDAITKLSERKKYCGEFSLYFDPSFTATER